MVKVEGQMTFFSRVSFDVWEKILDLSTDGGDSPLSSPWLKWICFKLKILEQERHSYEK